MCLFFYNYYRMSFLAKSLTVFFIISLFEKFEIAKVFEERSLIDSSNSISCNRTMSPLSSVGSRNIPIKTSKFIFSGEKIKWYRVTKVQKKRNKAFECIFILDGGRRKSDMRPIRTFSWRSYIPQP